MRYPTPLWLLAVTILTVGCAGFQPQPGPGREPEGMYVPLTTPFIAVGDTQEHESTGYPLHDNDSAIDAFVEVAQRPPEQPLFGRRILEWSLRSHPTEPYLHLGDVMDLSCRSEAERMMSIFQHAGRPGAILPGNHDGLMFGIYGYNVFDALDANARRWNLACRRGAAPDDDSHRSSNEALSKREFIQHYLAQQSQAVSIGVPDFEIGANDRDIQLSWRSRDPNAFVSAVEARLVAGFRYANSFIAQRLRLPRVVGAPRGVLVIALDTNQAGPLVSLWDTMLGRSPGSRGHVHPDQVDAVKPWIDEAIAQGDIVVFAGHHHWNSLGLPTRLMLRNQMSRLEHPLVYLSAHTHRGFWAVHRSLDRRPLLELNVSSLSDWPISYRRIQFAWNESDRRLMVRAELRPHSGSPIENDGALLAAWTDGACAQVGPEPDAFSRFDIELVQRQKSERGSLIEWLLTSLNPTCESCDLPLYRHAHSYQDSMLTAIMQVSNHLGARAHRLYDVKLPAWCGDRDYYDCARDVQNEPHGDRPTQVALFRRKAELVNVLGNHLDDLREPQAVAYMTCRAVHAAKVDFDATPDHRNNFRGEANRRAESFFRTEVSIGMD